jgi:serine O-acetyltransferase
MTARFFTDLKKYKEYSKKNGLILILTQQGLWALWVYRISSYIFSSRLPRFIKAILLIGGVISQLWIEIITGITLPYSAKIGHSFYIGHHGNIIINANSVIGNNCNISQGVTIGVSGRDENRGVPVIGNNVYIGANATIAGSIHIGDNSVIGANSLVIRNVSPGTTVVGVPAQEINSNDSSDYI